jgi:hypothetical protein
MLLLIMYLDTHRQHHAGCRLISPDERFGLKVLPIFSLCTEAILELRCAATSEQIPFGHHMSALPSLHLHILFASLDLRLLPHQITSSCFVPQSTC